MKCENCKADVLDLFNFCHRCGKSLQEKALQSTGKPKPEPEPHQTFEQFRKRLSSKRQEKSKEEAKKKKLESPNEVMINIGIMKLVKGILKPVKGKVMTVRVLSNIRKQELLKKGIDKHSAYDRNFEPFQNYALLYPDGSEILTLPGQPTQLFQLDKYKEDIAKPYNRITLYLADRELLGDESDSDLEQESYPKSTVTSTMTSSSTQSVICTSLVETSTKGNSSSDVEESTKATQHATKQHCPSEADLSNNSVIQNKTDKLHSLKDMFPARDEQEVKNAIDSTESLEEAVNLLINADLSLNDAYASLLSTATDNCDDYVTYHDAFDDNLILDETATTFSTDITLQDILNEKKREELKGEEFLRLKIRRHAVWEDVLFKWKRIQPEDITKPIKVQFIGEPAVDHGGPLREFFSLINSAAQKKLMCSGIFRHNISSLERKEFHLYGELTAVGLMQGFPGPKCFTKTVVDYILTGDIGNLTPSIEDIPNAEVKQSLQDLIKISDEEAFKNQATFNCDYRFDAGYCKPFVYLKDKDDLCRSVALHYVIISSITETNQYIQGLKTCNMLDLIRDNPALFRKTFEQQKQLTANFVDDIFEPEYSPKQSNKYAVEQKIVFNFSQYLEDIEQGQISTKVEDKGVVVTLKHVLQFVTGADDIPAIGFTPRPTIKFSHNVLPKRKLSANTCANILTIPVADMEDYSKFAEEFTFCMMNSPGFGVL
jgi:hypothetical protein